MKSVREKVSKTIHRHVIFAMAVGLVPAPIIDLIGITAVQLAMVLRLTRMYHQSFYRDKGKHIIATLAGSSIPVSCGTSISSFVKTIPIVGHALGAAAMPVFAGASTYALGKIFVLHFESGGTILNLDPEAVKSYYADLFDEGKQVSTRLIKTRTMNRDTFKEL